MKLTTTYSDATRNLRVHGYIWGSGPRNNAMNSVQVREASEEQSDARRQTSDIRLWIPDSKCRRWSVKCHGSSITKHYYGGSQPRGLEPEWLHVHYISQPYSA